ncbi:MAG TPA: amino acid racemase [Rhizomicrobium sp.]|jgi:aspartate racemase|nr:amino acid racemase [Rhizomicrobium sp.]
MKIIGMIGGLSWESSKLYYELINREVAKRLGGNHSAKLLLYSLDFDEVEAHQSRGHWDEATKLLADAGARLGKGGADFLIIACNTAHRMADAAQKAANIPLLHIADPLGAAIAKDGLKRVGLIGSVHTMNDGAVIKDRLARKFYLEILAPDEADGAEVDRAIMEEFIHGRFLESTRARFRQIMARLVDRGAQGIILGCTEIPLLVKPGDAAVPLYDTTTLHALAAVELALG